jgi:hypothetical protein
MIQIYPCKKTGFGLKISDMARPLIVAGMGENQI